MIQLLFILLLLGSTYSVESSVSSKRSEGMMVSSDDDQSMPDCDENGVYRSRRCKRKRCLIISDSLTVEGSAFINNLNVTNETAGSLTVGGVPFGSLLAYSYSVYTGTQAVADNTDVIFTLPILSSSNVSTDTPDPSAGLYEQVIVPAGTYAFSFQATGVGATTPTNGLIFELFNHNGSGSAIPNTTYISDNLTATAIALGAFNVRGFGIATFGSTTAISLRNVSGQTIDLQQGNPTTPAAITASMTLIRIAS